MAEAKVPLPSFLPGEDPEAIEANRKYQEALELLNKSLDTRKNRFFDPTWLAAAEAFLTPTKTGGFGESLGNVARNVGAAQAAAQKEEQDIAQQRLAVAGQGLELQRLKSRDAELSNYLNPTGPVTGPKAAPAAGPLSGALAGPKAAPAPAATTATAAAPAGPLSQGAPAAPAGGGLPAPSKADKDKQEEYDNLSRIVATFNTPEHKKKWMESGRGSEEQFINEKNFWESRLKNMSRPSAPAAAPEVKTIAPQAVTQAPLPTGDKPPGFEGVDGIQVAPPNPNFMSARDYVRLNRFDKSKSPGDLIKEGQEIEQKRYRDKEGGVLDLSTGKFYQYPTGKTEEVQLYGYPGTYSVDARTAARLSMLAANNDPAYYDLAKRVVEGPQKAEGKSGEPSRIKSKQEMAVEQKENEARAGELGKKAAEKEAAVEETDAAARSMFGGASRVLNYLKESPNFYGIFERPTITAAVLGAIDAGIKTKDGSISIGDLQNTVTKLLPNVTQKDLDNVKKAAAELAEMELTYTKLFLSKQGAVTEGERKIVRAIPGTISSSPEVLRSRMELIKLRTQKDIDVADAYRQWQDQNPGRSYFEFERNSQLYKDIKNNYEADLGKMFDTIKAIPTSQRKKEAAATKSGGKDLDAAKARVKAILGE
jgi:hypothetical protein